MENISNLKSNLPKSEDELADVNAELSKQFKAAANSVASLYKASTQRTQLVYKQGYLQCLDDILEKISKSQSTIELEQWLILKKLQLENSVQTTDDNESFTIPSDIEFLLNNKSSINKRFPPTNPILSVDRKSRKLSHSSLYSSPMRFNTPVKQDNDDEIDEEDEVLDNFKRKTGDLSLSEKKQRLNE